MLVSSVFFEYCALVVPTAYWHCHSEYRHIIFCFHSVYCLILTLVSTKKIQMFLEIIDNQFVASFFECDDLNLFLWSKSDHSR